VTHETVWSAKGTGPPPRTISTKNGSFQYDAATNSWIPIPGTAPAAGAGGTTDWQTRVVNGHVLLFDKKTGTFYDPGTHTPIDPGTLKQITAAAKPLTGTQQRKINAIISFAKNGYYAVIGSGGSHHLPQQFNWAKDARTKTWTAAQIAQAKKDPKVLAGLGVEAVHLADSPNLDPQVNRLYLQLISDAGLTREQAFNSVGKFFPGWKQRNQKSFFPNAATGGVAGASVTQGAMTSDQAKQYAAGQLGQYGWSPTEINALVPLWNGESGWNYQAKNSSSGALGIPQALGHTLPPGYADNAATQIDWGLQYIHQRYQTPTRALAFWNATVHHNANLAPLDLRNEAQIWINNGWGGY